MDNFTETFGTNGTQIQENDFLPEIVSLRKQNQKENLAKH